MADRKEKAFTTEAQRAQREQVKTTEAKRKEEARRGKSEHRLHGLQE
jgi:hypothetical protein